MKPSELDPQDAHLLCRGSAWRDSHSPITMKPSDLILRTPTTILFVPSVSILNTLSTTGIAVLPELIRSCGWSLVARALACAPCRIFDFSEQVLASLKSGRARPRTLQAWVNTTDHTEAISRDPQMASAYTNRGFAWRDKGEHDKASSLTSMRLPNVLDTEITNGVGPDHSTPEGTSHAMKAACVPSSTSPWHRGRSAW